MPSVSELSVMSGASISSLWFLKRFGLEFDDDDFDLNADHKKALNELQRKRLSPYVLAYALRCRADGHNEDFARYDNLVAISKIRRMALSEALADIRAKQVDPELLSAAQYWLDRATADKRDPEAFERIARWCKAVLAAAPPFEVDHAYLAVRLLASLPREKMRDYPRLVQRALNRTMHHGFLDGWYRKISNEAGKNTIRYFRPKFDL